MNNIQQVARQAALARAIELVGHADMVETEDVHRVADAVAVAVLREVEGELRRHGEWSNTDDPVGMAHSAGYRGAAEYVAGKLAGFTPAEPQTPEPGESLTPDAALLGVNETPGRFKLT